MMPNYELGTVDGKTYIYRRGVLVFQGGRVEAKKVVTKMAKKDGCDGWMNIKKTGRVWVAF